jgi:hypothetical protein
LSKSVKWSDVTPKEMKKFVGLIILVVGAGSRIVGWGTVLQARRLQVRFPLRSLDFPIGLIFQPCYSPRVNWASNRNQVPRIFLADNLTTICEPIV